MRVAGKLCDPFNTCRPERLRAEFYKSTPLPLSMPFYLPVKVTQSTAFFRHKVDIYPPGTQCASRGKDENFKK